MVRVKRILVVACVSVMFLSSLTVSADTKHGNEVLNEQSDTSKNLGEDEEEQIQRIEIDNVQLEKNKCGSNCRWKIENKRLIIYRDDSNMPGELTHYENFFQTPWSKYKFDGCTVDEGIKFKPWYLSEYYAKQVGRFY